MNLLKIFDKPINSYLPKGIEKWEDMYLGENIKSFIPETVEQAKALVKRARIASRDLHSQNEFAQLRLKWMVEKGNELQAEKEQLEKEIEAVKAVSEPEPAGTSNDQ